MLNKKLIVGICILSLILINGCTNTKFFFEECDKRYEKYSENMYNMVENDEMTAWRKFGIEEVFLSPGRTVCQAGIFYNKDPSHPLLDDGFWRGDEENPSVTLRDLFEKKNVDCKGNKKCYLALVLIKQDVSLCDKYFVKEEDINTCKLTFGFYVGDKSYCNLTKKKGDKIQCLKIFGITKKESEDINKLTKQSQNEIINEIKECRGTEKEISSCIIKLALNNMNKKYCDNFPENNNFYQGKKVICYGLLAVKTGDLNYCNHENEYYLNSCRNLYDHYLDLMMDTDEFIDMMLER